MLGIYALFSGNRTEFKSKVESFTRDDQRVDIVSENNNSFALISPESDLRFRFHKDGINFLMIDGFIFSPSGERVLAKDIYEQSLKDFEYLKKLNGEFFIVLGINNRVFLINDIMGQRQHCLSSNNNNEYSVAPSPGLSLKLLNAKKVLNRKAFLTFIVTRKLRYKQDSIWEKCKIIQAGSIYEWNQTKFQISQYWRITYHKNPKQFEVDKFIELYKKAVNSRLLSDQVGITLTGGLDSRSIIGAINKGSLKFLKAYTMGIKNSKELTLAETVARDSNVEHVSFEIKPEFAFDNFAKDYFQDEDIDLITQGFWKRFLLNINNQDYLLHGLDLDVTLGGIYLNDELKTISDNQSFLEFVEEKNFRLTQEEIIKLFQKDIINNELKDVKNFVKDNALKGEDSNYIEKYDRFIMENSMNRVILQRYRSIRSHQETLSPMYDRDILEYLYSTRIEDRMNYKAFHPFINKLCPELSKIEYQRTGIPANVPVEFWRKAQEIESNIESFYRRISCNTEGEIYIPYMRYYTNVDEWMRFNEIWMIQIKDLLQSENSIIRKNWINGEYLDKMIEQHQKHRNSYFGIIQTLMSAEIYLRIE